MLLMPKRRALSMEIFHVSAKSSPRRPRRGAVMSRARIESWPATIVAFLCFGFLLGVVYVAIYTLGPDLVMP